MRTVSSRLFLFVAFLGLGTGGSLAATSPWQIDPAHSAATFSVRHLMISNVKGEFSKVTGVVNLDEQDVAKSTVEVTIDVNTLNTREPDRDKHLRTADFFDVQNFPTMTFRSKRVEQVAPGKLKVTGDLTIRGVTREATFDVDGPTSAIKDPWGNTRAGASATTHVNRQDFGLKWSGKMDNGGVVVGDDVTVTVDVELIRKAPQATRK
jgi:polyisoprenoid-binding protein YceI